MNRSNTLLRMLFCVLLTLAATGCSSKRSPVDPAEGAPPATQNPPSGETPSAPAPVPDQPAPTPPAPRPAPPLTKPRQPAKGDTASTKLVENGMKQMNSGNLDSAEQLFEQALRVSPTNGKPYYYLGVVAAKSKEYDRSLGFLEQAEIYLKDDDFWLSQVYLQEGLSLRALGRKPEARSKFEESLRHDPTNQWAQNELKKP